MVGEMLEGILSYLGHEVCAIESTETGTVEAALERMPDLLIADFHLSPGSGIAAVDRIAQTRPCPHILVSGSIARVRELRPHAIMLEKPYTVAGLASAIHRACGQA